MRYVKSNDNDNDSDNDYTNSYFDRAIFDNILK